MVISGGLQKMNGKMMRIGHMGCAARPENIRATILALEAALADAGFKIAERGAALRAADAILRQLDKEQVVSPL